jgi:hypothetical protein
VGRKVRSPVDFAVGLLRSLDGTTNTHQLAADLEQNGQGLFFPPNVKGWEGGRTWIKSSSIVGRANLTARLMGDEKSRFSGGKLDEYFSHQRADKPEQIVDLLVNLLLAVPLPTKSRDGLIEICRANPNRARGCAETIHALPQFRISVVLRAMLTNRRR